MSQIQDTPFPQDFMRKCHRNCVPLAALISFTWACSEHCRHCLAFKNASGELTAEQWRVVLYRLWEAGTRLLTWTGGDPFARMNDFLDVLAAAASYGVFRHRVFTNAMSVTSAVAKQLKALGVEVAEVSVYGQPENHDFITQVSGSYDRTMRGIAALHDAGILVRLKSPPLAVTVTDLEFLLALPGQLGLTEPFRLGPGVYETHTGGQHPLQLAASLPELARALVATSQLPKTGRFPWPPWASPCNRGRSVIHVDPHGRVFTCEEDLTPTGSLLEQPLSAIMATAVFQAAQDVSFLKLPCWWCALWRYCPEVCSARFQREHNGTLAPSAATCRLAREVKSVTEGR